MIVLSYVLGLFALTATCFAQVTPVDLTIAYLNGSTDVANAPTVHVYGIVNTTFTCLNLDSVLNDTAAQFNGTRTASLNYTLSNFASFDNKTDYTSLWYEQLNVSGVPQNPDNVGTLAFSAYPCRQCRTDCSCENPTSLGCQSSPQEGQWLQWTCNAKGAAYRLEYPMRSFALVTVNDGLGNLDNDEQNDKCMLATIADSNSTNNNNTHPHQGAGVVLGHSMMGVWSTVMLAAGLLFWA